MAQFSNQTVIVTGGASGLGRASAKMFAREGALVAILDIDSVTGEKTVLEIQNEGYSAVFIPCDLTDENQVAAAFDQVISIHGSIDILHANAGIIDEPATVDMIDLGRWKRIMAINVDGMFLAARYAVKQMLHQQGGVIVFTGSNWAYVCDPGFSSYAASKGAVVAFARALALDHAKDNIRINVVCPGNMLTPLLERQLSLEKDPEAALQAMGQVSTPDEVANLVVFLASKKASAMKGSAVIIDQGETLGYGKGLLNLKGGVK